MKEGGKEQCFCIPCAGGRRENLEEAVEVAMEVSFFLFLFVAREP